ncbi:MAG: HDOD domain-containing protein [Burkholderiales bacterium]|nr:HDOD domain-containing protein [Burkholderiales bacterium]
MAIGTISDIIKRVRDLPSLPAVVMDLMTCIDQEGAGARTLGERLARDQALAAKTLRLANSSFYGMQRKVSSIPQAIAILGFDSVRTMVAAVAVAGAFPAVRAGRFDFEIFWRHAIASAICAKVVAKQMRIDGDQAFVAGLLHDIGRLVLVMHFPQEYEAVLDYRTANQCRLRQAELDILEIDHAQVGRMLAEHWKFPVPIQNAIASHHDPVLGPVGALATAVQVANCITFSMARTDEEKNLPSGLTDRMLAVLGISEVVGQEILNTTKLQFEEVCRVLLNS